MKKIMKKSSLLFSLVMLFAFAIGIVNAQEENNNAENQNNGWIPTQAEIEELDEMHAGYEEISNSEKYTDGLVDCFDYYTFQSVQVSLDSEKDLYSANEIIKFSGYVENENEQPVTNGMVFARISKNNENIGEGPFIVDELIASENIALNPKEKKDIEFEWNIPNSISSGDYKADFFFSVGKKFNLGGLPFSNEIIIGTEDFKIESQNESYISFDRSETKVNGDKYNHIGNWPVFDGGEKITIAQPILNTFNEEKDIDIRYELYYWDSLDESDLINSEEEKISVPANGIAILDHVISEMNDSVYYLKITASSGDQMSIINLRFTSEQEHPRFNYPAITKFPITKGDEFTLFSCFHNTSSINTEGKIVLTLSDKKGKEIGSLKYNGSIPSAMSAAKNNIKADSDYEYLKLKAEMYDKDGKMVDEYETVYDCQDFNSCKSDVSGRTEQSTRTFSAINILIFIFFAIVVSTVIVVFIGKKKGAGMILLLGIVFSASFLFSNDAQAANALTSKSYKHWTIYVRGNDGAVIGRYFGGGKVNVTHRVNPFPGRYVSSFPVGENLSFNYSTPSFTFNNSDGAWDTPYGKWVKRIDSDRKGEDTSNTTYWQKITDTSNTKQSAWISWSGVKPAVWDGSGNNQTDKGWQGKVFVTSGNKDIIRCLGMNCTAQSPGTATLTAHIPETQVRIWSKNQWDNARRIGWPSEAKNNPGPVWQRPMPLGIWRYFSTLEDLVWSKTYSSYANKMWLPAKTITWTVTVIEPNNPPVAVIDEIYNKRTSTGPFYTGEKVNFTGTATDSDGTVNAWRWGNSCGNASYSSIEDPNKLTLPKVAGNYTIYFRVQDNDGSWSVCDADATRTIKIVDPPEDGVCDGSRDSKTFSCDDIKWPPGSDYCESGNPSKTPDFPQRGETVDWTCEGINGSVIDSGLCSAQRSASFSASCGGDNEELLVNKPTDLCAFGNTASSVTVNGDYWEWTCTGACSDPSTASCKAEINTASNWIEVPAN